ncbi:hypothetical protein AVEN_40052-1, partial [Araneus ventricosus]
HIGIVGNEKADIAAKEARRITWPYVPLPDIDGILRFEVSRSWQEIWNTQVNNKLHYWPNQWHLCHKTIKQTNKETSSIIFNHLSEV